MTAILETEPRPGGAPPAPRTAFVPLDFSERSMAGLAAARLLARRWGLRLELVHIDPGPPACLLQEGAEDEEPALIEAWERSMEARLREAAEGLSGAGYRILNGDPREELPFLAACRPADLIVMGIHGRSGLRRLFHAEVAEAVVHASAAPVLTVPAPPGPDWPRSILVPMKFADYADGALNHALAWGRALGARVSVVHVLETDDAEREEAEALNGHLERILGPEGYLALERILTVGPPAEAILQTCEKGDFDLVVLAAHFKPFWKELVLGSTAEFVVRRSKVPVLAIPAPVPGII